MKTQSRSFSVPIQFRKRGEKREQGRERGEGAKRERDRQTDTEKQTDRQTDTQTETESISVKLNYYVIIKLQGISHHNQMSLLTAQNGVLI